MRGATAAALLMTAGIARADDDHRWGALDWTLEGAYATALAADYSLTRDIRNHPGHRETNPLLGSYPSRGRLAAIWTAQVAGHAVIARLLPIEWRRPWQYVLIGFECAAVEINFNAGLRFDW